MSHNLVDSLENSSRVKEYRIKYMHFCPRMPSHKLLFNKSELTNKRIASLSLLIVLLLRRLIRKNCKIQCNHIKPFLFLVTRLPCTYVTLLFLVTSFVASSLVTANPVVIPTVPFPGLPPTPTSTPDFGAFFPSSSVGNHPSSCIGRQQPRYKSNICSGSHRSSGSHRGSRYCRRPNPTPRNEQPPSNISTDYRP